MITEINTTVRPATANDRRRLASLIHFEEKVHRHLDWKPALDWLGADPFFVVVHGNRLVAALACPPDPDQISWIRLFVTASSQADPTAWSLLWPPAREQLVRAGCTSIAAIPMQPWFTRLLAEAGFQQTHTIVLLTWDHARLPPNRLETRARIRPMTPNDLPAVHQVDSIAFEPLWQNSLASLELAYQHASVATIAEDSQGVVAYQISTLGTYGGHLARLAVHPRAQRRGIGQAILHDLLTQFSQRGILRVSVNTQRENLPSLALYRRFDFRPTGEEYPVYQMRP